MSRIGEPARERQTAGYASRPRGQRGREARFDLLAGRIERAAKADMGRAYVSALVHHHDGRETVEKRLSPESQAGQSGPRFSDASRRKLREERPAQFPLLRLGAVGCGSQRDIAQRIRYGSHADLVGTQWAVIYADIVNQSRETVVLAGPVTYAQRSILAGACIVQRFVNQDVRLLRFTVDVERHAASQTATVIRCGDMRPFIQRDGNYRLDTNAIGNAGRVNPKLQLAVDEEETISLRGGLIAGDDPSRR